MKKIILPILILFLFFCNVFAQTPQTITLKPGFNFVSFTSSISITPVQLKTQNPAVEDIYMFSAAAGSFLSANDGTLSTLAAGKGYIIKSNAAADTTFNISGDTVQTIGNVNIKTGFNLIGFSKIPSTTSTFKSLMNVYPSIKGIYKWSPVAGSFIQVVRTTDDTVTLLDGVDPTIKAGESYFFNMAEDTTINYDGTDIILGNGPPAPVAKTLEITGTVGASTTASPSYSVARAIDLSTMQISVYDEINNASVEGAVVTATGANTFKATLPVATVDRYLSVLVKNLDNKVVYKSFLGRIPKATEVTENTVKISNIKVSDESTARAIIVLENRAKIPMTAVIAQKSVDTSISNTDFALVLEEHIAGLEDRVPELKPAVSLIANVLTTANVDATIKQKVTAMAFSDSTNLLKNYVSLMQDANTLKTVNNITAPAELTIGNYKVTAQSALGEIDDAVIGMNDTIGQRVEMPVLDPPPGQYNTPVLVEMTCATPNANIVYDYGDGNPGVTYTAPIFLTKTCTLNVAAFRSDWPMSWHSKFVNATYTIGAGSGTAETRVLSSITLDRTSEAIVVTTEKYYLSNIKISAHYSNGDSKEVQATRWEMVSSLGIFSDMDNSYLPWGKTGEAIFNAIYSEGGIEKQAEFKLKVMTQAEIDVIENSKVKTIAQMGINGGELILSNGISINFPINSLDTTGELSIFKNSDNINTIPGQQVYTITSTAGVNNMTIRIPLKDGMTIDDIKMTCFSKALNKLIYPTPVQEDYEAVYYITAISTLTIPSNLNFQTVSEKLIKYLFDFDVTIHIRKNSDFILGCQSLIKNNPTKETLKWPYYRQYGNMCWATTWFMLMKGYAKELGNDEDSIFKLVDKYKDSSLGYGMSLGANTIDDLYKKIVNMNIPSKTTTIAGFTTFPFYYHGTEALYYCIINSLSQGKPAVIWSADHAIVILGYEYKGDLSNISQTPLSNLITLTKFWIHDPLITPNYYCDITELKKRLEDVSKIENGFVFIPLNLPPVESERRLQTIHLPQPEGTYKNAAKQKIFVDPALIGKNGEISFLKKLVSGGLEAKGVANGISVSNLDFLTDDGTNIISNDFDVIRMINLPAFNMSKTSKPAYLNMRVYQEVTNIEFLNQNLECLDTRYPTYPKVSIFSIFDPKYMIVNNEEILDTNTMQEPTYITSLIAGQPITDFKNAIAAQTSQNGNEFVMTVNLHDENTKDILDKFSLKFKYDVPLNNPNNNITVSLSPGSMFLSGGGEVDFIATVNGFSKSSDINWSVTGEPGYQLIPNKNSCKFIAPRFDNPPYSNNAIYQITATSVESPDKSAAVTITVTRLLLYSYISYWDDNKSKIREKYSYIGANIELNYHGTYESYYEDGKPESRGNYDHGKKINQWTYWDKDGNPRTEN